MKSDGTNYKDLFKGLCDVLQENSQGLSEGQRKAIEGFLDVLIEAVNKNWSNTVKDFISEQKISNERNSKTMIEKRDAAWTKKVKELVTKLKSESKQAGEVKDSKDQAINAIMGMLESIKGDISNNQVTEADKIRKEFDEFKQKSILATNEAIKNGNVKIEALKNECAKKDKQLLDAGVRIRDLEGKLRKAELSAYLESKIQGIPAYEASLMRKRFADAKSKEEIDTDFQRALKGVQERRNALANVPKNQILEVQTNQFSESTKEPKVVNLLTETTPTPTKEQLMDPDFVMIDNSDEPLPQEDVARWITAIG